ncbi:outer membrane murein-binding lipoprotein Lpp [Rhizobium sp. BK650]|nr:outer membrane murein-binding lipoprotein Lpp [Rhizobium sp. BK650]
MNRTFLLAAAVGTVAALAGCRSAAPAADITRAEIPAGSATVRAGLLDAKRKQQQHQRPLTDFQTRCHQRNGALHCQTTGN